MRLRHQLLIVRKYVKPEVARGIHLAPAWRVDNSRSLWEVVESSEEADAQFRTPLQPGWILVTAPNSGVFLDFAWDECEVCDGTGEISGTYGGDDNGWGAAAALVDWEADCEGCDATGRSERFERFLLHADSVLKIIPWTTDGDFMADKVKGKRLLVRPDKRGEKSPTDLVIPEAYAKRPTTGVIAQVGDEVDDADLTEGTRILYSLYAGTDFEINGEVLLLMDAASAMMILDGETEVGT